MPWLGSAFLEEASYYKLPFPDQSGSLARFPNFQPFFLTEQLKLKQGLCFQSVAARRRIPRGFCLEEWSENDMAGQSPRGGRNVCKTHTFYYADALAEKPRGYRGVT